MNGSSQRRLTMKEEISTVAGIVGGFIAMLLGGWDTAMITLVIFMAIDFTTGFIAAMLGRSKHSWTGRLSSKAGWYGLAKKFCTLLIIVVAVRIDLLILMGVPYPDAIKKAIDVFQKKAGKLNEDATDILDDENKDK